MPILHKISIILLYFAAFVSLNNDLVSISLYLAIPLSFIFSLSKKAISGLFKNRYFKVLIILYLWCALTSVFALSFEPIVRQFNQILGVIILYATIVNLSQNQKNIPWLYGLYIVLAVAVYIYVTENIFTIAYDISTSRIGDDKLDSNTVAYYTFFATCAFYILGFMTKPKSLKKLFTITFLLMIPASFWIAIYTASRQVLIIQIPLIALLIYVRFFYGNRNVIKYFIIGLIALIFGFQQFAGNVSDVYNNSYLKRRSERQVEKDPRIALMNEAIEVGLDNPIWGVGPGNFAVLQSKHMFSHCSFTELFANSGLPALFIYTYLLASFPILQVRNYKRYKKKSFLVFAVIGVIYFFYNFFYVFYIDLWLMSFFALITSHSLSIKNNSIKQRKMNQALLYQ